MYHVPSAVQCIYMDGAMKEVKMGMEWRGVSFMEDGREWRFPCFLYADDFVLCGELEEDLKMMGGELIRCVEGEN